MKNVVFMKNGQEVKCYRIREAFMTDGYRVLVDDHKYGKKDAVMVADDGKSDRVFLSESSALQKVIDHANKLLIIKGIDSYIVREV